MAVKKQASPKRQSKKPAKKQSRSLKFNNKFFVLIGALLFGAFGAYFVFVSNAQAPDVRGKALAPFEEIKERGMAWKGLSKAEANSSCANKGYEVRSDNGVLHGCSHGPDPAPEGVNVQDGFDTTYAIAQDTTTSAGFACIGDGKSGPRVQAIYAVASDRIERFNEVYPNISMWAGQMQDAVTKSAAKTGGERYIRFATNNDCSLNVAKVILSPTGDDTFANTINELKAQGYGLADRNYVIWADAIVYCGIGHVGGDTSSPLYGRVDTGCWSRTDHSSSLHELMHNFGAVDRDAPNGTAGWHCSEESDAMCYRDSLEVTMTNPCTSENEKLLDCNNNDYFHTNPPAGSYLATNWNTAMSRYFAKSLSDTGTTTPTTPTPTTDTTAPTTPTNVVATSVSSNSIRLAWSASTDTGGSGLSSYRIWRNNVLVGTTNAGTTSYTDSSGLTAGTSYTYRVSAVDFSNNESLQSPAVTGVTLSTSDVTLPQIVGYIPADNAKLGRKTKVSATATDNTAVVYMSITIDGVVRATSNSSTVTFDWNTNKALVGLHTITYTAKDAAGNTAIKTINVYK